MDKKAKDNYIKDDEFNTFLEQDFVEALEEDLKDTPIGMRILMLQKIGLDISLKSVAKKYVSKAGYTMEPNGRVYIQDDMMQQAFSMEEMRLSEELKVDISKLTDPSKIQKIMAENNYKASVDRIGVEATIDWFNLPDDFKNKVSDPTIQDVLKPLLEKYDFSEANKFKESMQIHIKSEDLRDLFKNNKFLNMKDEDINNKLNEVEKDTVDYHINNKETSELMRLLYQLKIAEKDRGTDETAYQAKVAEIREKIKAISGNMQYQDRVLGENGELDDKKALSFLTEWEDTRNDTKVFDVLSTLLGSSFEKTSINAIPSIIVLIGRAAKGKDTVNQEFAISLANKVLQEMGYELLDKDGKINLDLLSEKYKELRGDDADLFQAMKDEEWNEYTAFDKLDRVDGNIDKQHGYIPVTRDGINDSKEAYDKLLDRLKTEKKESFAKIVEDNNLSKEQILTLFYEYRKKETVKNERDLLEFGPRQLTSTKEHGTARIIFEYMCEHQEEFQEYFSEKGNLLGTKINNTVLTYEYTEEDIEQVKNTVLVIDEHFGTIEKRKDIHEEVTVELNETLEKFIGVHYEDISQEDKDFIFEKAKILAEKGELSDSIIMQLSRIDRERYFNEIKVARHEARNGDFQEALANTIGMLGQIITFIPKKVLNLEEEEIDEESDLDEKPKGFFKKIFSKGKKSKEEEADKKAGKVGTVLKNIFSRNKQKQLPEAQTLQESGTTSKQVNSEQRPFDINQRHEIDHRKAIEQSTAAVRDEVGIETQAEVDELEM